MSQETHSHLKKLLSCALAATVALGPAITPAFAEGAAKSSTTTTASPIKHVIVIVGENRTFDHLFATYVPKSGETINNLLSEGIVTADGKPGPNFSKALQYHANIANA